MADPNPDNDDIELTVSFYTAAASGIAQTIELSQQAAIAQNLSQLDSNKLVLTDLANYLLNNIDDLAQPFVNQANTRNGQLIIDYVEKLKLGSSSTLNTINAGLLTEEKLAQGAAQASKYASFKEKWGQVLNLELG